MSPVRNQPLRNAARRFVRAAASTRGTPSAPAPRAPPAAPSGTSMPSSSTRCTSTLGQRLRRRMPGRRSPSQRVRQRHADLGHPVALEQRVAGDLAPALEHVHRQRRRPRHHQPQPADAVERAALQFGRRRVPGRDRAAVDRRHRREHGDLARRQPRSHTALGVEGRQHLAGGAHRQRRAEPVDDAVHVVQRQHQQQAIRRPPAPGLDQRRNLRADVLVRRHDALRLAGRAAGVDDHRPARRAPGAAASARAVAAERVGGQHEPRAARPVASGASARLEAGIGDDDRRAPQSRITYSSSAGGCDTASGTATPPARQMPRCTAA